MRIAAFILALVSTPVFAQSLEPVRSPSYDAFALARALDLRPPVIARGSIADARTIEANLLTTHYVAKGPSCDPALPACAEAARQVAREVAPEKEEHLKAISARYYGRIFDEEMSPDAIRNALKVAGNPEGRDLVTALRLATGPSERMEQRLRYLQQAYQEVKYTGPDPVELFFQRTRGLPRGRLPVAPPAPPPPPPPPPRSD